MPTQRSSFVRTLAAVTALGISACHDSPVKPKAVDTAFTLQYIGLEFPVFYVGQQQGFLVIAKGVNNVTVAGVKVTTSLPAGGGALVDTTVITDSTGKALFTWSTPTKSGAVSVNFKGELGGHAVSKDVSFSVFAGAATSATASVDSLRFTSVGSRAIQVSGLDQYDNATGIKIFVPAGTITAALSNTTLTISSGSVDTTAVIEIRSSNNALLKNVKAVSDFVVNAVELVGGIDTQLGLAVGEKKPFKFTAKDSANAAIGVSATKAGIQFFSTDTAKLLVSTAGDVTGVSIGAASVYAKRGTDSLSLLLNVFAGYDLGAVSTLFLADASFEGQSASAVVVAPSGGALQVVQRCQTHPSGPCNSTAYWYSPAGTQSTFRSVSNGAAGAPAHDGGSYASAPLARYDSVGGQLWATTISGGSVVADSSIVVVGGASFLRAVSTSGADLWTTATAAAAGVRAVTPARIYANVGSNLAAFARSGAPAWEIPSPGIGVADENSVYFAVAGSKVTAIAPDGSTKWTFQADVAPTTALGPDASLIVATANKLRWLDRGTGAERFNVTVPTSAATMAATATRVFVTASGGYLNVYNAGTGEYLGRTTHAVAGGPFTPVCTTRGLMVASPGYDPSQVGTLSRFTRCQ